MGLSSCFSGPYILPLNYTPPLLHTATYAPPPPLFLADPCIFPLTYITPHMYYPSYIPLIYYPPLPTATHGFPFETLMTIADQLMVAYPPSRLYALEHDEEVRLLMRQRSASSANIFLDNLSYTILIPSDIPSNTPIYYSPTHTNPINTPLHTHDTL